MTELSRQLGVQPRGAGGSGWLRGLLRRGYVLAAIGVVAIVGLVAGLALAPSNTARHSQPVITPPNRPLPASLDGRPNIVFVLTDDLAMNLLRFMPHVQALEQNGLTFRDYFVTDSLCCPSRASIFTGNLPHDTKIFSNTGRHGGFREFYARGEEQQSFSVALKRAGYRTAMMGKYLNGYMEHFGAAQDGTPADVPPTYVPPGWSQWDVVGYGYPEFDYDLNHDGQLRFYGHQPSDYLTDVISRYGVKFIDDSAAARKPFFLELATFAPHFPYVPAPRNAHDFPGLQAPRPPSFNVLPTHAPSWLRDHPPLDSRQLAQIDRAFRRRAQSVEAVDDMIGRIEQALAANGLSDNTYIVFSSDNGLHMGDYRLMPGKLTAFDTDIRVPLIVDGPGVPAGVKTDAMAENIDLAKTFASIAGTGVANDGHSLVPLLLGTQPGDWRNAVLIEHHGPHQLINDPDFQQSVSGNPWTYEAMRTHRFLYVEYSDGEREFYDLRSDPFELHNLASNLAPGQLTQLHADLLALESCHDGASCWSAMHVDRVSVAVSRRHRHR